MSSRTISSRRSTTRSDDRFRKSARFRNIESLEGRCLLSASGLGVSSAPLSVSAEISRRFDLNGDNVVLTPRVMLVGQTSPGARVGLDRDGDGSIDQVTRANRSGRFSFPVRLSEGRNSIAIQAKDASGQTASTNLVATRSDVVLAWNTTLLNVIRQESAPPTTASRAMAMVQLAVYDAVNAVGGDHTPYHYQGRAARGTSAAAAASEAAYRVLLSLYPNEKAGLDASLKESLATTPPGHGRRLGIQLGDAVAEDMLTLRADDGATASVDYVPGTDPGEWIPTPPKYLAGLSPQWPSITPFAMTSDSQFRPPPPPAITSAEYAAAYNEVKSIASINSTTRTADQTELSRFWSDNPGVTFTPPGHWNQIAQDAAMKQKMSLRDEARLFGVLDAALADAAICCWDGKYFYNYWRPVTAIRAGDQDGNPDTDADPNWTPLWITPNFPSYASGHSTFSGAAQSVLESYFGTNFAFTDPGDPTQDLAPRSFTSFEQAADEAGMSRVYGGIHFQFDNTVGLQGGRALGRYVVSRIAR